MASRGRHTVFLGMAPGVGKTYQMLEEAHEERLRGRDVVIGLLEAHERADTLAQAEGLETLPLCALRYRGVTLEEPDCNAIVRRAPELCLIDELAHANAPGSERRKRYEDVEVILAAGIDVFSTVNVQHLESMAARVTALTGVRVGETLPDSVLEEADEVVLVDITPQMLMERLNAGRIFSGPSLDVARAGFFRPERLARLRELAVGWVAEEIQPVSGRVAAQREPGPAEQTITLAPALRAAPSRQRVLALATPLRRSRATVHPAFDAAWRLDAPLDVLWVGAASSAGEETELESLERLVTTLGARCSPAAAISSPRPRRSRRSVAPPTSSSDGR